ncbi:hypothetical protein [Rhodococcus erythropolis]|uniref:hypothetical protein n=1 Tax=Rhodococcus erythropolis TaxID=1833 RepID=UPI0022266DC8|nr:hypothetical protein [Rhodococcus erythropolis]MCW2300708.1 hypothetical protein [Rhodococcus erythropolis]
MTRSRASARKAGTTFERSIADGLAQALDDDRIDRRVKTGSKDRGDIGGVRVHGQRLVVECKDVAKQSLPQWTREAQLEAGNDDALVGVVVAKRRGTTNPLDQWVHMTVRDLVALITGQRQDQS